MAKQTSSKWIELQIHILIVMQIVVLEVVPILNYGQVTIFQQDNARLHIIRQTKDVLRQNNIGINYTSILSTYNANIYCLTVSRDCWTLVVYCINTVYQSTEKHDVLTGNYHFNSFQIKYIQIIIPKLTVYTDIIFHKPSARPYNGQLYCGYFPCVGSRRRSWKKGPDIA
jgi:hypothetical protein